jgi:hypothetical protein
MLAKILLSAQTSICRRLHLDTPFALLYRLLHDANITLP